MEERVSVFILAGGKSSRMGTEKGLAPFRGKPLIQHLVDTLAVLDLQPVIIAHHPDYQKFGASVFGDLIPDKGPLGGIFTALSNCETDRALILSCDSPLLQLDTVKKLTQIKGDHIVVACQEDRIHPFPGIYPKSILPQLRDYLEGNKLRVQGFILDQDHQLLSVREISSHPESEFVNMNSPEDLINWK